MAEAISKIIGAVKDIVPLITKHLFPICAFAAILCWLLLLLPTVLFEFLGFETLRTTYRSLVGIVAFTCTIGLLFISLSRLVNKILTQQTAKKIQQEQHLLLCSLTPVEYQYLSRYTNNQTHTCTFTVYDGVVAGLITKGILYKPESQQNRAGEQDYNIYTMGIRFSIIIYRSESSQNRRNSSCQIILKRSSVEDVEGRETVKTVMVQAKSQV